MESNMAQAPSDPEGYRYERKFFISGLTKHEIELIVKLHPSMFSEIYDGRVINNIYLDSLKMKNYFDNVEGIKDRVKVRIRWYGDSSGVIEKPVLELKIKNGMVGRKERFPLIPFTIDDHLQVCTLVDVFRRSEVPDALQLGLISLKASLFNRYRRKYFQSADRKWRLTIDSEMEFYQIRTNINTFLHKSVDLINTVVELKYDPKEDQYVEKISNHFPFRMTKSSKYVNGMERAYF